MKMGEALAPAQAQCLGYCIGRGYSNRRRKRLRSSRSTLVQLKKAGTCLKKNYAAVEREALTMK